MNWFFSDTWQLHENRKTLVQLVEKIVEEINIPFTVGGGISEISDGTILKKQVQIKSHQFFSG